MEEFAVFRGRNVGVVFNSIEWDGKPKNVKECHDQQFYFDLQDFLILTVLCVVDPAIFQK